MKSKSDAMQWIPLWVDKWIFGTTRIELEPDERSVWVDLMAVAAKDHGFIRANVGVAYPSHQLSGLLCITEELLLRAIQKCINVGKLEKCENGGGYLLVNWDEYQLTERHKRRFKPTAREMSAKTDIVSENEDRIVEESRVEESILEDTFVGSLKKNNAYSHINIENEICKMDAWLSMPKNKGRKKTQRFILNWLNKIEKPMQIKDTKIEGDYPKAEDVLRKQGFGDDYFKGVGKSWKNK